MGISFNGRTLPASGLIAAWDMRFPPYVNAGNIGSNSQSTDWHAYDHSDISVSASGNDYRVTATSGHGFSTRKMYGWEAEGSILPSTLTLRVKTNTVPAMIIVDNYAYITTDEWKTLRITLDAHPLGIQIHSLTEDIGFDILLSEPIFALEDPIIGYSLPTCISQNIYDLTGNGNTLYKGSSLEPNTNDPSNSITGQVFGSDDVCSVTIPLGVCTIAVAFTISESNTAQSIFNCGAIYMALEVSGGVLYALGPDSTCNLPISSGSHVAIVSTDGSNVTLTLDNNEVSNSELLGLENLGSTPMYLGNNMYLNKPIKGSITSVVIYNTLADTARIYDALNASLEYTPYKVY